MNFKIDTDLKRMYTVAGVSCRPAIALTSIAAALRVWVAGLEFCGSGEIERNMDLSPIEYFKMTVVFIAEAAVDQVGWQRS